MEARLSCSWLHNEERENEEKKLKLKKVFHVKY